MNLYDLLGKLRRLTKTKSEPPEPEPVTTAPSPKPKPSTIARVEGAPVLPDADLGTRKAVERVSTPKSETLPKPVEGCEHQWVVIGGAGRRCIHCGGQTQDWHPLQGARGQSRAEYEQRGLAARFGLRTHWR